VAAPVTRPNAAPADDAWLPRAGTVISGKYAVERLIGKGGMAAVVAARQTVLGEHVAIKILHPKLASDAEGTERFFREARATARIRSEHVVRVLDVGQSEVGLPYIVMELLRGADLGRVLESGPLHVTSAVDYVLQACEALAEAHALGIVHRDLKPSNLWLSQRPDGTPLVKVLDFGISKLAAESELADPKLTETQSIFGSPMYMSPEQIRSAKRVDHRTDVWAIGVVLYELLTGELPFEADTAASALASITADPPRPLRGYRPEVPQELEAAIFHCLVKDVSRRCQSLGELGTLLAPFASPSGKLSADRLSRIGQPHATLVPLGAVSSGRLPYDPRPTETAFTARGGATPGRATSPALAIGIGASIALFMVALVLLGMRLGSSGPKASSGAGPSAASAVVPPGPNEGKTAAALAPPVPSDKAPAAPTEASAVVDTDVPPSPSASSSSRPKVVVKPAHGYSHGRR
jgi:serine/threonine protein kinase